MEWYFFIFGIMVTLFVAVIFQTIKEEIERRNYVSETLLDNQNKICALIEFLNLEYHNGILYQKIKGGK